MRPVLTALQILALLKALVPRPRAQEVAVVDLEPTKDHAINQRPFQRTRCRSCEFHPTFGHFPRENFAEEGNPPDAKSIHASSACAFASETTCQRHGR